MPRPKSKSDLLEQSQQNFKKLFDYIGNLSQEEQEQEFPAQCIDEHKWI